MDSVILITTSACDLAELRAKIPSLLKVSELTEDRVAIERGAARANLSLDDQLADELSAADMKAIRAAVPNPTFHALDFNDINLCREVLVAIADRADLLVQNENGARMSGAAFVARLKAEPGWDFRLEEPA